MTREYIVVQDGNDNLVDKIPLLSAGRGRYAERRNKEIAENDKKLREYFKKGFRAIVVCEDEK